MQINKLNANELKDEHISLLLLADPSEKLIREYCQSGIIFDMKNDNDLIGIMVLFPFGEDNIEIKNIAVDESYQGNGYGKQLLKRGIEFAKQNEYKRIRIGTGNSSLNQLGLYQKCGFRMVRIDKDFFIRNYEEEIVENGIQCRDMVILEMKL
ncbi:GNAT family N-acetyltransferase [Bacillus sp. RG28]|uniref:GNAT family N-acetyltransferase n=1 Tax=Gottfriedia endophytica TaxID=2820819 RepID=A0A940SIN2_9BACI|nr:GNAT family N-acetyltransferase [Gottfriedia endophytica]MBP0723994.1 GNAT family N-acetyltransferase [Gottfriedia endophytica]